MNKLINEANWDRIVRALAGVTLIALGLTGLVPGAWGIGLGVVGLILLATGAIGFCPLYRLIGFHTN